MMKSNFLEADMTPPWVAQGGGVWQRRMLNELSESAEFLVREW